MVNSQISFSNEDKIKVYEMKQKIFSLTFDSTMKRAYRRIIRGCFRKLFVSNVPILSEKKPESIGSYSTRKSYTDIDGRSGIVLYAYGLPYDKCRNKWIRYF